MDQLFNDEVLRLILNFSNPNKREMEDADKLVAKMSLTLRDAIKDSLAAGKSVGDLVKELRQLGPVLKSLETNAGRTGLDARVLGQARQMLGRYTPDRVESVRSIGEIRQKLGVETSGTEALRSELVKVRKELELSRRRQENEFYRVTGSSPVGRGLYVDTETAFDPRVRQESDRLLRELSPMRQHLAEVSATLFTFNKQTGEILNSQARIYHGFQQLENYSRNLRMPRGITREMLSGQSISPFAIAQLAKQADFIVAHNAPFDRGVLASRVPQLSSMRWLDSMRDIPWREMGFQSRAQQDLLKAHGIDPGQAHRSSSDVQAAIKLLGSSSPFGGPNYLSMMLGNRGPLTSQQESLAVIKQSVDEAMREIRSRLGDAPRYGWAQPRVSYRAADPSVGRNIQLSIIDAIEGGPTAYGIKGSGGAPEPTPQGVGGSAIALDRRMAIAREFVRNLTIMSGPSSASTMLSVIQGQSKFQEGIQQYAGSVRRQGDERRTSDDVLFAMMRGTNTQLRNRREGLLPLAPEYRNRGQEFKDLFMQNLLQQPWAQGPHQFLSNEEIQHYKKNPDPSIIPRAAYMARSISPRPPLTMGLMTHQGFQTYVPQTELDPRYNDLAEIILSSQGAARSTRRLRSGEEGTYTAPRGSARERFPINRKPGEAGFMMGDFFSSIISEAGSILNSVFGSSSATAGQANMGGGVDYAGALKAMRRDDALARMQGAANKAADAFEEYARVIRPSKIAEAQARFDSSREKLTQAQDKEYGRIDSRGASAYGRINDRLSAIPGRAERMNDQYDESLARLGYSELRAQLRFQQSRQGAETRRSRLMAKDSFVEANQATREALLEQINAPVRSAQVGYLFTQFRRQMFEAGNTEEAAAVRQKFGSRISEVTGNNPQFQDLLSSLPLTRGGAQKQAAAMNILLEEQKKLGAESAALEEKIQAEKQAVRNKYANAAVGNEEKLNSRLADINTKYASQFEKATSAKTQADNRVNRARERYALEDAAAAQRGSGRGGGGGGGGGNFGLSARGGLDFGLGLAGLAAYGVGVRELLLDSTQYAARTQQLGLTTAQMARTNFIEPNDALGFVGAVKRQNVTTQESYSVVQRMIQAQLDLSKAPQLARVAQNVSVISGTDPSEAFNRIIMGLVTGYTRQLHLAGLQVSSLATNRELKGELGRDPSEYEKRQGLLNAVLLEGARTMGVYEQSLTTAAGQFTLLTRQALEAKNAIGGQFLPEYGRMIQIITSGLKFVEQHPEGTSKAISGALGITASLGTAGTLAFAGWGAKAVMGGLRGMLFRAAPAVVGAGLLDAGGAAIGGAGAAATGAALLNPWGLAALAAIAGVGYGTYKLTQGDDRALKVQQAQAAIQAIKDQQVDLGKINTAGPNAEFNRKYVQIGLKASADSIVSIQKNLAADLARDYNKQEDDFKKSRIPNYDWVKGTSFQSMDRSYKGGDIAGIPFSRFFVPQPPDVRGVPELGISSDQVKEAMAYARQQDRDSFSLNPEVSRRQMRVAGAVGNIQEAQKQMMGLEEAFKPGGKYYREQERRGTKDNPRQRIADEVTDFEEKFGPKKTAEARQILMDEYVKGGSTNEVLADSIRKADVVALDYADRLKDVKKKAGIENAQLDRQLQVQIRHDQEALDIAYRRAQVIPGNYASETKGIEQVHAAQVKAAEDVRNITGDPDVYKRKLADATTQQSVAVIEQDARKRAAERARVEYVARTEGGFTAQGIMGQSGLTMQTAIVRATVAELDATKSIVEEETRRRAQLDIVTKMRHELVAAAKEEAAITAEFNIGKFANQADLFRTVSRAVAGRGRRGENERALDEIEVERKLSVSKAQYDYDERIKIPGLTSDDRTRLSNQRDLEKDSANSRAAGATIQQLERNVNNKRQEVVDAYHEQFQRVAKIQDLQANGPAEEIAAADTTFKLRMEYIKKEAAARGSTVEAEKQKRREMYEAEFDQATRLLEFQRQKYAESRNFAGGLFEGIKNNQLPQFFKSFFQDQAKTIFQNITSRSIQSAFGNFSSVLGPQFSTDASGKTSPTLLGRALGGSIFSNTSGLTKTKEVLEDVQKQSVDAEKDLTQAVKSLDDAIRRLRFPGGAAIGGGPGSAPSGGGGFNFGGSLGTFGSIANTLSGAARPGTVSSGMTGWQFASGLSNVGNAIAAFGGGGGGGGAIPSSTVEANAASTEWLSKVLNVPSNTLFQSGGGSPSGLPISPVPGIGIAPDFGKPSTLSSIQAGFAGFNKSLGSSQGLANLMSGKVSIGSAEGVGSAIGAGATVIGGAMSAISGFKKGGGKGTLQGISGVLTAASVVPGPQQPFIAAAAAITGLVSSLLGDPKEKRMAQEQQYLELQRYQAPVQIDRTISAGAGSSLISENAFGVARSTGIAGFPVNIIPNQRIEGPDKNQGYAQYTDIPGRVGPPIAQADVQNPLTSTSGGDIHIHMPVSAIDTSDIIKRGPDFAMSIATQLKNGTSPELDYHINKTVFGAG